MGYANQTLEINQVRKAKFPEFHLNLIQYMLSNNKGQSNIGSNMDLNFILQKFTLHHFHCKIQLDVNTRLTSAQLAALSLINIKKLIIVMNGTCFFNLMLTKVTTSVSGSR